jgi:hypothetical protein
MGKRMRTIIIVGIALSLIVGRLAARQQNPTGTIQGTVLRGNASDPLTEATVSLIPEQTKLAYDALAQAGEGVVMPGLKTALPDLLVMSVDDFKTVMTNVVPGRALPPAVVAGLAQLQSAKESTRQFPIHALTDSAGHFTFNDVPAGRYIVTAQHDGFFGTPVAGSSEPRSFEFASASVVAGQTTSGIAVTLVAGATIAGHVFDDSGAPVSNYVVDAQTLTYLNGLPTLLSEVSVTTDDRGAYRLFYLPPGDYLVGAAPQRQSAAAAVGASLSPQLLSTSAPEISPDVVVKTFYPNIITPTTAMPISVRLGDDTEGIDIRMRTVRTVKVFGRVINNLGPPVPNPDGTPGTTPGATLQLLQRDSSIPDDIGARSVGVVNLTSGSGLFTIGGILPGDYDLYARIADPRGSMGQGGNPAAWGRATIEVRDKDIEGVTMTVHPSVEVKGNMKVNGSLPNGEAGKIKVGIQPEGSSLKIPNYRGVLGRAQTPGSNGSFTIPGVAEGEYRVQVLGLPENSYVDDVRQGGRFVYDSGIVVGNKSPDPIEVLVNTNGGTIDGNVITGDRKPSVASTVVLIPDRIHRINSELYKATTTDKDGRFTIRGIHPGVYSLLAWEAVPSGAYMNSVFLSKYESQGVVVTVGQQSNNATELRVIPNR